MSAENKKNTKSHTTVYFPKQESDFLLRAIKVRGEQMFGKSSHGKASAYLIRLIKKDLKENELLEYDSKNKKIVPNEQKLKEIEEETQRRYNETLLEL